MGRYQDALDYIFGYVNYEKKARYPYDAATFDLTRMEQVLDLLGRPHEKFRSVHIAGTKGKGSTSAMVEVDAAGRRLPHRPVHLAASAFVPRAHPRRQRT